MEKSVNIWLSELVKVVVVMEERRRAILQELNEKGRVRVADLSRRFGCSEVTIRNDIKNMDTEGMLKRIHGGGGRAFGGKGGKKKGRGKKMDLL